MTRMTVRALCITSLAALSLPASAQIAGFNNGANFVTNTNSTGSPQFTGGTLTLTTSGPTTFEARSAYFNTPQSIATFSSQFTYQATNPAGQTLADGATFILQNQGVTALGGNGGALGMSGISPSAEVEFNVYNFHTIGTNFETNGTNSRSYHATGLVNLASGDSIQVNLAYNGTTLTETLKDLATANTFTTSYVTNLSNVLGGNTALVGFTGGTGAGLSTQTISNFTFNVPEPSAYALFLISGLTGASIIARRKLSRKHV